MNAPNPPSPTAKERILSKVFKLPSINIEENPDFFIERRQVEEVADVKIEIQKPVLEKLKAAVRPLSVNDVMLVDEFLQNSAENWGPFRGPARTHVGNLDKIEFALSEWNLEDDKQKEQYNKLHRIYFGCFYDGKMVGGIICGICLSTNPPFIEVGGLAANGQKGRGFGSSTVSAVVEHFLNSDYRTKYGINTIISVTQINNEAAKNMLTNAGFALITDKTEKSKYDDGETTNVVYKFVEDIPVITPPIDVI